MSIAGVAEANGRNIPCCVCSMPTGLTMQEGDGYPVQPLCPNCTNLPRAYTRRECENSFEHGQGLAYAGHVDHNEHGELLDDEED